MCRQVHIEILGEKVPPDTIFLKQAAWGEDIHDKELPNNDHQLPGTTKLPGTEQMDWPVDSYYHFSSQRAIIVTI